MQACIAVFIPCDSGIQPYIGDPPKLQSRKQGIIPKTRRRDRQSTAFIFNPAHSGDGLQICILDFTHSGFLIQTGFSHCSIRNLMIHLCKFIFISWEFIFHICIFNFDMRISFVHGCFLFFEGIICSLQVF